MPKFILSQQFYLKLSDILADIAQIVFAALVIPILIGGKNTEQLFGNLLLIISIWASSLWVAQKSEEAK